MAIATALALAAGAPASTSARISYQPIQGAWNFEGGRVLVQPVAAHRFVGIVLRKTRFGTCTHPRGQRMWQIDGSAPGYTGSHLYFKTTLPCAVNRPGEASWTMIGSANRLRFCSAEPGTGAPGPSNSTTLCHTLKRAAVPASLATACSVLATGLTMCLRGPSPLRSVGCLPRSGRAAAFSAYLTGSGASRATVTAGPFHLDRRRLPQRGRTLGGARRVSFSVMAARFAPGRHLLRAGARLGVQRRTLTLNVWVCG
jgi:hypothetical protein